MLRVPPSMMEGPVTRDLWFQAHEALKPVTANGALGIDLVDLDADTIVLQMAITDAVRQPYGLLHGGASLLMAESAASMHACWGLDLTRHYPVGIEVSGSHLRSAREGHVQARGRVLRRSRTLVVHQVDIVHVESGDLLSVVRVTNLIRSVQGDAPPRRSEPTP